MASGRASPRGGYGADGKNYDYQVRTHDFSHPANRCDKNTTFGRNDQKDNDLNDAA